MVQGMQFFSIVNKNILGQTKWQVIGDNSSWMRNLTNHSLSLPDPEVTEGVAGGLGLQKGLSIGKTGSSPKMA